MKAKELLEHLRDFNENQLDCHVMVYDRSQDFVYRVPPRFVGLEHFDFNGRYNGNIEYPYNLQFRNFLYRNFLNLLTNLTEEQLEQRVRIYEPSTRDVGNRFGIFFFENDENQAFLKSPPTLR